MWSGNRPSFNADPAWRQKVADDALRCADLAAAVGIPICYEFHDNTLTDRIDSACDLLAANVHPFIKTLWKPPSGVSPEDCLAMLPRLVDRLRHLHVFYWEPDYNNRRPLASGARRWTAYLAELRRLGWSGDALLEFVDGDDPAKLPDDAATLLRLLSREN